MAAAAPLGGVMGAGAARRVSWSFITSTHTAMAASQRRATSHFAARPTIDTSPSCTSAHMSRRRRVLATRGARNPRRSRSRRDPALREGVVLQQGQWMRRIGRRQWTGRSQTRPCEGSEIRERASLQWNPAKTGTGLCCGRRRRRMVHGGPAAATARIQRSVRAHRLLGLRAGHPP